MRACFILFTSLLFSACSSDNPSVYIQEFYTIDSSSKGERFDQVYLKLRHPVQDTVLTRIAFPFKIIRKLSGQDWKTEEFENVQQFQQSPHYHDIIKSLRKELPYNTSYKTIFANASPQGQNLKIVVKESNVGFRFISKDGIWLISEYAQSLQEF